MSSKFLKREKVQRVIAEILVAYVRAVYYLTRWTMVNSEALWIHGMAARPFIVCFWHGRMIPMVKFWHFPMKLHLLGSRHADARLVYKTVQRFGVETIIGSSDYGGTQALRTMVKALRAGDSICMTPDGPRGPRMRANIGIVALAKMAGVPIVPVTLSSTWGRVLKTWDRFFIPFPGGRGTFIVGNPITVPRDADPEALEAARLALENSLNAMTAEADRRCGQPPVEPAPADEQPAKIKTA